MTERVVRALAGSDFLVEGEQAGVGLVGVGGDRARPAVGGADGLVELAVQRGEIGVGAESAGAGLSAGSPTLADVNWLAAYGFDTDDTPARLGRPATLTVVLRDLDNDSRTYEFLPIEPAPPGEEQREAILRAMAGRFPDARWKTYNAEKQIASFVGRQHLYIVIYEEHDVEAAPEERPTLFAVPPR